MTRGGKKHISDRSQFWTRHTRVRKLAWIKCFPSWQQNPKINISFKTIMRESPIIPIISYYIHLQPKEQVSYKLGQKCNYAFKK